MKTMQKNTKILPVLLTGLAVLILLTGCKSETASSSPADEAVFPKGIPAPADFFTGRAWVYGLVANDSIYTMNAGKVTFEPGARSHWHAHPAGQILLVTSGVGYHQIRGQAKERIRKGDVVQCPPDAIHWHGASEDSSMTHIYILPNTEKGIVEWMDAVTDEEFKD